jgi:hypothetical protein
LNSKFSQTFCRHDVEARYALSILVYTCSCEYKRDHLFMYLTASMMIELTKKTEPKEPMAILNASSPWYTVSVGNPKKYARLTAANINAPNS